MLFTPDAVVVANGLGPCVCGGFCDVHVLPACVFTSLAGSPKASGWDAHHWTTEDGLPDNGVRAIAQTPDGYLWIGTLNGLARRDGFCRHGRRSRFADGREQ